MFIRGQSRWIQLDFWVQVLEIPRSKHRYRSFPYCMGFLRLKPISIADPHCFLFISIFTRWCYEVESRNKARLYKIIGFRIWSKTKLTKRNDGQPTFKCTFGYRLSFYGFNVRLGYGRNLLRFILHLQGQNLETGLYARAANDKWTFEN